MNVNPYIAAEFSIEIYLLHASYSMSTNEMGVCGILFDDINNSL